MQTIFYYRHKNNEIYELKFNKVLVNTCGSVSALENGKFDVEVISAEVAGLGTLEWTKCGFDNTLVITNIYDSIEKAIRGNNINTIKNKRGICREDLFDVNWGFPFDCNAFDLDIDVPSNMFIEEFCNCLGLNKKRVGTWVWNGVESEKKFSFGVEKVAPYNNSHRNVYFDLISREFIYDKSIVGYGTREECTKANSVKIHRF